MKNPKDHLAQTLKQARKDKGLSLDKTADLTGVSKAMLGQIERGESSPTVSTLWKIATGLDVSLTSFIEPKSPHSAATLVRTADDIRQHPAAEGLQIAPLYPYDAALGFEYMELTFESGYERLSEEHASGVIEFVTIISGSMEVLSDGTWHALSEGQSIRFAGDAPHGYRNKSQHPAKVLSVIHYPYLNP